MANGRQRVLACGLAWGGGGRDGSTTPDRPSSTFITLIINPTGTQKHTSALSRLVYLAWILILPVACSILVDQPDAVDSEA